QAARAAAPAAAMARVRTAGSRVWIIGVSPWATVTSHPPLRFRNRRRHSRKRKRPGAEAPGRSDRMCRCLLRHLEARGESHPRTNRDTVYLSGIQTSSSSAAKGLLSKACTLWIFRSHIAVAQAAISVDLTVQGHRTGLDVPGERP